MDFTEQINGSVGRRITGRELSGAIVLSSLLRRQYRWLAAGVITGLVLAMAYCLVTPRQV